MKQLNIKKTITIVVITVFAVLSLSGCTTFENFKEAFIDKPQNKEDTILIGVFEPMSGADKEGASLEVEGIELAHEMYPELNGKKIELIYADNNSNIDAAETAIETLISREPSFILGSYGNVYSLTAGSYINKAKIPTIAITSTNPLITKNYKYYCRVCYVDANQGSLLARYVLEDRKETKAGVLIPSGDDAALAEGTSFVDGIRARTEDDDAVTLYEHFEPDSKEYAEVLNKVRRSGVKQVMIAGDSADAVKIINQAAEMGIEVQFLGNTEWGTVEFRNALSNSVKSSSIAFVQFFAADGKEATAAVSKEKEIFLNAYAEKHGGSAEPEGAVALGYDAYCLALDALSKAPENASSKEIIDMISGPEYQFEGASGLINIDSKGDPIKTAYISTWIRDKVNTLYTLEPEE